MKEKEKGRRKTAGTLRVQILQAEKHLCRVNGDERLGKGAAELFQNAAERAVFNEPGVTKSDETETNAREEKTKNVLENNT